MTLVVWKTKKSDYENGKVLYSKNAVQGDHMVLHCEKDEHPLLGLKVFGKSAQKRYEGNQLLNIPDRVDSYNGVTKTVVNGVSTLTGTSTGTYTSWYIGQYRETNVLFTLEAGIYTVTDCQLWSYDGTSRVNKVGTFTIQEPFNVTGISTLTYNTGVTLNETLYPMLNIGDAALPFEPYVGNQLSPSPDYPQEIVSVGDSGSVEVGVYGGNLADQTQAVFFDKTTAWVNDEISIEYESRDSHRIVNIPFDGKAGMTYFAKCKIIENNTNVDVIPYLPESLQYFSGNKNTIQCVFTPKQDVSQFGIYVNVSDFVEGLKVRMTDFIISEMDIPYEPYIKQSLIASTQNGLPGIPVSDTSLSNYTDSNGQMWCCDEVDLEQGLYIQRIGLIKSYSDESISVDYMSTTGSLDTGAMVQYILATPIEAPLSEEELAAYQSLRSNYPVTTVINDANAWMEIKYPTNIMYKPKTDWKWINDKEGDYFNKEDYNRIIGNIEYLREMASKVNPEFDIVHLDEKTSYADYIYADEFNTIEGNLTKICKGTFPYSVEEQKMYYPNQPTPDYAELNRIESILLKRYEFLQNQIDGRKTLSFVLGGGEF